MGWGIDISFGGGEIDISSLILTVDVYFGVFCSQRLTHQLIPGSVIRIAIVRGHLWQLPVGQVWRQGADTLFCTILIDNMSDLLWN